MEKNRTAQRRILHFTKMQGCGNDYIYIDCFKQTAPDPAALCRRLSQPHFGVGADGLILICPSTKADARMRIFNKDGSEGAMCGNGLRCVAKYLYDSGRVPRPEMTVETESGVKALSLKVKNGEAAAVTVDMGKASFLPQDVPVLLDTARAVDVPARIGGETYHITCVSMGNPHCVVFGGPPEKLDLPRLGPLFENAAIFPERVNTEFVEAAGPHTLRMRVWERGSGETLACGTGACAAAAAAVENGLCEKGEEITVQLAGGELNILYTGETVYMTGGAETVFTGEVRL